eukprot:gnl/TRDRNA2_/TRDRNA2_151607_c1_seq3.p1 gnl/TRDRNA2_/TRDRNA2_151607_c1~~gnl/TRDRNA2_/TRDRNA2_151607_c1_seq3.p1  ORF type:complete len:119 (+),score=6.51 gnl/TRDRNA2_/TRDRNA2_151607_c1_seq3:168-524(+)
MVLTKSMLGGSDGGRVAPRSRRQGVHNLMLLISNFLSVHVQALPGSYSVDILRTSPEFHSNIFVPTHLGCPRSVKKHLPSFDTPILQTKLKMHVLAMLRWQKLLSVLETHGIWLDMSV